MPDSDLDMGALQPRLSVKIPGMVQFLQASESLVIEDLVRKGAWVGQPPTASPAGLAGESVFGLIPYWLNHEFETLNWLVRSHNLLEPFATHLNSLVGLLRDQVPAQITPDVYRGLRSSLAAEGGFVSPDGAIYGLGQYELLDPRWFFSLLNHLVTLWLGPVPTVVDPPAVLPLGAPGARSLTIALVSDWGTGRYTVGRDHDGPALDVMNQIMTLRPDYLIHLGDVYYSGTPRPESFEDRLLIPPREEVHNFLGDWPRTNGQGIARGWSFALNSNHEMYAAGAGYFQDVLGDERFSAQRNGGRASSIFALSFGGWTILGLDSAYFDPSPMVMTGSLGGARSLQARWIRSVVQDPASCIVLTHHAPITYDAASLCTYENSGQTYGLWPELTAALGQGPAAWYYGHLHNGVIYKPGLRVTGSSPTRFRCLGNGSLPYGSASGLIGNDQIACFYQTPNPLDPSGIRIRNGFVLLSLSADGHIDETFYQQGTSGSPEAIYSNSYTPGM
jgi:hypothetical protein